MGLKIRTVPLSGELKGDEYYQYNWTTDPSPGVKTERKSSGLRYVQNTVTDGHHWPPKAGDAATDIGGVFSTKKVEYMNHTPGIFESVSRYGSKYIGPAWPFDPYLALTSINDVALPTSQKLDMLGTTAVARSLPTNPVADAGTFIGELREGLPKRIGKELLKSKFKDYRKVGGEYLNVEFGWKPIISDLQKFGKAAIESDKILQQLHRDSGKTIRRKYNFPVETSTKVNTLTGRYCWIPGGGALSTYLYDGSGTLTVSSTTETKSWFSGAFTYHVNLGNTLPDRIARNAAEARKLYGIELTPETVWNLAPWSWLVDWEGNIGDVLHNVTRFSQDGLVMRYGYIMQETTLTRNYNLSRGGILTTQNNSDLSMTVKVTSKSRQRATPFGFGFDMSALTGRQSAILGALGISRGPRR